MHSNEPAPCCSWPASPTFALRRRDTRCTDLVGGAAGVLARRHAPEEYIDVRNREEISVLQPFLAPAALDGVDLDLVATPGLDLYRPVNIAQFNLAVGG